MPTTKSNRPAKKSAANPPMSEAHKAALAKGREQGRVVRNYLEALDLAKPRRGRRRTSQAIRRRLAAIEAQLAGAGALQRLQLVQERMDLESELASSEEVVDIASLEKGFVKVAKGYGARKGVSYSAWRAVGVSASVLQKAGIGRARG
jgi:hypothetical protein